MQLTGRAEKSLDFKGRLSIPKKLREPLLSREGRRMALLVLDGCVQIFPWQTWTRIQSALESLPLLDPSARELQRQWGGTVQICELDREGRVVIGKAIKEAAGIEKDVVIIGAFNRLEVWSKERWQEHCSRSPSGEALALKLSEKGHQLGV
jgi:MraZ protein